MSYKHHTTEWVNCQRIKNIWRSTRFSERGLFNSLGNCCFSKQLGLVTKSGISEIQFEMHCQTQHTLRARLVHLALAPGRYFPNVPFGGCDSEEGLSRTKFQKTPDQWCLSKYSLKEITIKHCFSPSAKEHTLAASIFRKLMSDFSYGKTALKNKGQFALFIKKLCQIFTKIGQTPCKSINSFVSYLK